MSSSQKRRIAILQGHPDATALHLCHALTNSYAEGAREGGHEVKIIDIAALDFPLLRSQAEFSDTSPLPAILQSQETIKWADHLLMVFPLWLGTMPAIVKGFWSK